MTQGRHSLAPRASKPRRIALVAAPLVTCGLIGVGVAVTGGGTSDEIDFSAYAADAGAAVNKDRGSSVSRSAERGDAKLLSTILKSAPDRAPVIKRMRWTTADLELRLEPKATAKSAGEYPAVKQIGLTGIRSGDFVQVLVKGDIRWVTAEYLAVKKPKPPAARPVLGKACPGHASVESGLTPSAVRAFRAVCNAFPQITSYGGWDDHGEHSSGRAVDIMVSPALGDQVADFLRAHAGELDLFNVIWQQQIWTSERAGDGWRTMSDRGSATANHMDHVHVSVN